MVNRITTVTGLLFETELGANSFLTKGIYFAPADGV